ncbi:dixin-like [Physella acuta]|uniref:dixin-like n=1 Tax=Physella acuta TaxID=109671 RepID=UPI0027DE9425|nr:dixin-like [Physella acuta]
MLPNSASQVSSRSSHRVGSQAKSSEDAQVWVEWRKQLTAYVAWVNSQLKKKPGAHLVEDLRHDVRDGVILIDLIEVIANEKISDIHPSPSTYAQMKENVDRVLQFMFANKIKMHHITTRDIVEGNLKAIMRLVLALAAHYKPNSVRHSTQTNKQNIAGIAQGAAAALTEARRNATRAGHRYRRRRQREESVDMHCSDSDHSQSHPSHTSSHRKSASASHVYPVSHQPSHHHPNTRHHNHSLDQRMMGEGESSSKPDVGGRAELEGASASSSPVSSHNTSPRASLYLSDPPSSMEGLLSVGGPNRGSIMITSCESDAMTDSGYTEIADSLKDTHQMLFQLHELLLNGENNHDIDASGTIAECANPKETITILKARLLHAEEVAENLRSENMKVKHDCRELHGTKAALQQRLAEQENQLSAAKTESMTFELEKEKLALELDALRKQLLDREQVLSDVKKSYVKQVEDKEKALADLRRELLKRDHSINVLTEKVNHLEREGAVSTRQVKGQMKELATDIKKIDLAGAQLEAKVNSQDYRLAVLADYLHRAVANQDGPKFTDLENIREHYKQTKLVSPEVPPNTVIDSLEDSLVKLLEKVHINGSVYTAPSVGNSSQEMNVSTPTSRGVNLSQNKRMAINKEKLTQRVNTNRSTSSSASPGRGSPSRRPVTSHPGPSKLHQVSPRPSTANTAVVRGTPSKCNRSQIPVPHGVRTKTPSPTIADVQPTNVIYYLENSDKPSTCVVRKKLGEIRLRDLKAVIPDSNLYHYFFKALDPEYGTVKEELSNDDDLLPGWEGKIVAWLEEESGTVC